MIIGITGSIGSGKTAVLNIFQKNGWKAINADEISHAAIELGKPGYKKVLQEFGKKILDKNRKIDRKKLGKIVFAEAKTS